MFDLLCFQLNCCFDGVQESIVLFLLSMPYFIGRIEVTLEKQAYEDFSEAFSQQWLA